jgi:hypothetical protein
MADTFREAAEGALIMLYRPAAPFPCGENFGKRKFENDPRSLPRSGPRLAGLGWLPRRDHYGGGITTTRCDDGYVVHSEEDHFGGGTSYGRDNRGLSLKK